VDEALEGAVVRGPVLEEGRGGGAAGGAVGASLHPTSRQQLLLKPTWSNVNIFKEQLNERVALCLLSSLIIRRKKNSVFGSEKMCLI